MRPCRKCGQALANNVNTCPYCSHSQEAPLPNADKKASNTIEHPTSEIHDSGHKGEIFFLVVGSIAFLVILGICRFLFGADGWTVGIITFVVLYGIYRFLVFGDL